MRFGRAALGVMGGAIACGVLAPVAAQEGTPISSFQYQERLQRAWIVRSQDNADGSRSAVIKIIITAPNQPDYTETSNVTAQCGRGPVHKVVVDDTEYQVDENSGPNRITLWIHNVWWALCRGVPQKFG